MLQFDPTTGSLLLPIWVAATLAALLVALAVMALIRSGAIRTISVLVALGVISYAGWIGSTVLDRVAVPDRNTELRAYEARAHNLMARAMQPGSTLACLDQPMSEQLTLGCERAVFGSAENVAAAVSFVSARVALLVDGLDAAGRSGDASFDSTINTVRNGLEGDPFGIVAYVFLQQANCVVEQCEALTLLRDPNKVRVHLQDKTFDTLVTRYSATWGQARPLTENGRPSASAAPAVAAGAGPGGPVSSKYEFPSSNSIPAVSIMNSEPGQATASTLATAPGAASPPREPRRPPGVRAAPATRAAAEQPAQAPAPVQLAPSGSAPAPAGNPRSTAQ